MMIRAIQILVAGQLVGGCIFAPKQYGSRGFVMPGNAQYQSYLANCRGLSPKLDATCKMRGDPVVIQIGHSAGLFAWRQPPLLLRVGAFGRTTEVGRVPRRFVPYMSDESYGEARLRRLAPEQKKAERPHPQMAAADAPGMATPMRKDEPIVQIRMMNYDPDTRKGCIAVEFAKGHYAEARLWARGNIETLVRDKNVALVTGVVPSEAKFYLGAERVRDGNILEIEFETE